ncbi:MAG TPA: IclR family transcriptional regulator [Gammaproteobacteria bacterium]|nr:IclR family transcriptional regulator [Gammaproteobacteria bacterium]
MREAPQGTQAVIRAIRLLKAFSADRPEPSLQELAAALHLTRTTAHRLLAALESEDLVTRHVDRGTYRLGPAAMALGMQALTGKGLRARVRPLLDALAAETGETATLEVLADGQMLILDEAAGGRLISPSGHVGTRWPLHATATGKLLLALVPETRKYLRLPLERYTAATITDMAALESELERARRLGYATATEELEEGFSAVATSIRDSLGRVDAVISLGGATPRLSGKRLAIMGGKLMAAAVNASQARGT